MKKQNDKLHVIYCMPGRYYPAVPKAITAKVSDGKTTRYFSFGTDYSLRTIHEQIPRFWSDFKLERRRKAVSR